jgi:hypothetical protein
MQVNRGRPKRDAQIASESGASPVLISVGVQFESLGVPRADLCREKLICFGSQLIFFAGSPCRKRCKFKGLRDSAHRSLSGTLIAKIQYLLASPAKIRATVRRHEGKLSIG